ncbi:hypothetical protein ACU8KH_02044 [Lachancea thermotolerans]
MTQKLDETGVEPMTSPMLRERATNYATRPEFIAKRGISVVLNLLYLSNDVPHQLVSYRTLTSIWS